MTKNKIKTSLAAICLAGCAGLAQAQAPTVNRGLYLGAGLGQSEAKGYDCGGLSQCENHGSVVKFFLGLQFSRNWALEVGYTDLGQVDATNNETAFHDSVKVRLAETTVVFSYPASARLSVYGKAGAYYARATHDRTVAGVETRSEEQNGGPTWGGGLQYFITNHLAVRGEAQRYMKVGGGSLGDSDYNAYSIGILLKF